MRCKADKRELLFFFFLCLIAINFIRINFSWKWFMDLNLCWIVVSCSTFCSLRIFFVTFFVFKRFVVLDDKVYVEGGEIQRYNVYRHLRLYVRFAITLTYAQNKIMNASSLLNFLICYEKLHNSQKALI